jgi:Uncharacterised nucleotidyltransferase
MLTAELVAALPPALLARRELRALRFAVEHRAADKREYLRVLGDNTARLARAAEILDAAAAAGVVLLPLKGALLADAVYGDAGARPMVDLDLAVRARDLPAAEAALAPLGFRRIFGDDRRHRPPFAHDLALFDGRQVLELHFRWLHDLGGRTDVEPLFARAIELETLGRRRLVPAWDDHLAIVAAHAASHGFGQAAWLVDLALLAERAGGFAAAAERARAFSVERAFATAVCLATLAMPSLPPAQLTPWTARRARWLAPLLLPALASPPSRLTTLAARVLMTDRATAAAAMLAAKARVVVEEQWTRATQLARGNPQSP